MPKDNKRTVKNGVLKIRSKNGIILIDAEDEGKLEGYYVFTNPTKNNYIHVKAVNKITKKQYVLSRLILNCTDKDLDVDHINHNTLDNRKSNLRICTTSQNLMNGIKRKNTSSRFKGVYFRKDIKRWQSYAKLNKKRYHLGFFEDELEAAKAYNKFAIKNFGEYALLNIIKNNP